MKYISGITEINENVRVCLRTIKFGNKLFNQSFLEVFWRKFAFRKKHVYPDKNPVWNPDIIYGGTTTLYSYITKQSLHGDPIFLIIRYLLWKKKKKKTSIAEIFDHMDLYIAYTDDSSFRKVKKDKIL